MNSRPAEDILVVIPHPKKQAVKDLQPHEDPANPPLSAAGQSQVPFIAGEVIGRFGQPSVIAQSTLNRAREMGQGFTHLYPEAWHTRLDRLGRSPIIVEVNTLGCPDSTDETGVVHGPRTYASDWWTMTQESLTLVGALAMLRPRGLTVMCVHRPHAWAARALARGSVACPVKDEDGEHVLLDPTLMPYLAFGWNPRAPLTSLVEIPRPA